LFTTNLKEYIYIQYKRFCRISLTKGVHPIIGALFLLTVFLWLSYLVFLKIKYPEYVYALIGIMFIVFISTTKRIEFLKQCFRAKEFINIRILENGVTAIPFVFILIYNGSLSLAILFLLIALILTFLPASIRLNRVIPSPFSRFPFEFTRGFRRTFFLHIIIYVFTYFAIESKNFNLSAFFLLVSFLISATYYSFAEPLFYLWIYQHSSKLLIEHKLIIIFTYSMVTVIPIVVSMIIFFPSHYWVILLLLLIGIMYVVLFMLAKYANYPFEISITDGFIVAASILFPPVALISVPFFYYRSMKGLNKILRD